MIITLLVPERARRPLTPLLEAYRDKAYAVDVVTVGERVPDMAELERLASQSDALLVIGDRRRAPRTVLPAPLITRPDAARVPVGWLPYTSDTALARFARAAAGVHRRDAGLRPIAVLAQWNPRYLRLAARIEQLLGGSPHDLAAFRWSSDLLPREEMLRGLGAGVAAAIYVGHGRPIGWVGYRGTRAHHFDDMEGEPVGALLSLCCDTASRRRTGLSFAEAIPLAGMAAAAFGAVSKTLHTDNTRWAVRLCGALQAGARTIGELIREAAPLAHSALDSYRLLGDPLAPLAGAPASVLQAQRVEVYP